MIIILFSSILIYYKKISTTVEKTQFLIRNFNTKYHFIILVHHFKNFLEYILKSSLIMIHFLNFFISIVAY